MKKSIDELLAMCDEECDRMDLALGIDTKALDALLEITPWHEHSRLTAPRREGVPSPSSISG
jgi:hypothetical protein